MTISEEGKPLRILYAENEDNFRWMVGTELSDRGFVVTEVASGSSAIEELTLDPSFGLIILDVMMTDGDGFDVLKHLEQHQLTIPVILMSGYTYLPKVKEMRNLGRHLIVSKPCTIETVCQAINRLLQVPPA